MNDTDIVIKWWLTVLVIFAGVELGRWIMRTIKRLRQGTVDAARAAPFNAGRFVAKANEVASDAGIAYRAGRDSRSVDKLRIR